MRFEAQIADRRYAVSRPIDKSHDEAVTLLPDPHFRHLIADQADLQRPHDIAGRQAGARDRVAIDGDPQLR